MPRFGQEDINKLIARYGQLDQIFNDHKPRLEAIAQLMLPRKRGFTGKLSPGQKLTDYQYDGLAMRAGGRLASFMHGTMTATSFPFFGLQLRNTQLMDVKANSDWVEECSEIQLASFSQSNWDSEVPDTYLTNIFFGTADPLFVEEGEIETEGQTFGGLHFKALPLGDCRLAEGRKGNIDVVHYNHTLPACEVFERWPDTCSRTTKDAADKRPYELVNLLLAIERRRNASRFADAFSWEMPYAGYYLEYDKKILLEEKGFHEFPAPCPRWGKGYGDRIYGRGLGDEAFPDVSSLNELVRYKLMSLALAVFPPLMKDIGFAGTIRWLPGAVHDVSGKMMGMNPPIQPILNGTKFDVVKMEESEFHEIIKEAFHSGLLQLPEKQMTAREAQIRLELMMRVLGPGVIGRYKSEFMDQVIGRSFGILYRAGQFPPPPPELANASPEDRAIDVVYKGPLAMAQRSQDTMAIDSQMETVLSVFERTQDPSSLDTFDFDEGLWHRGNTSSVPSKVLRGKDQVEKIRTSRSEASAAAAARAERDQMSAELVNKAKAAKDLAAAGMDAGPENSVPQIESGVPA